ncbi:MAG: virulence RhuM family protein [Candidatus Peribacteria bacterium]|jgi:hypothetical protein|nr:virulence RhuM family protein [Candidatus Peribacteria bacterium]
MLKPTNFLFYKLPEGGVQIEAVLHEENVRLSQKKMAELFGVHQPAIAKHLTNIFESGELSEHSVYSILEYTANDGKSYKVKFYNLDAIISVGYRVNSKQATLFRIRATNVLKEYIIKGFALDDERLKNPNVPFGKDFFTEMLERVRSIRASERRIYQQITDIFAECTINYDPNSEQTKNFYAMIQNKFHYAITGKTAAEIIYEKADASQSAMGLQTRKHAPHGRILKSDVKVAKNYLSEQEIKKLERAITGYFDYIERLIENETLLTMESLAESVNNFLHFNKYELLEHKGTISHQQALEKAEAEYTKFNTHQIIESDFDKLIKKLTK